MSLLEPIVIFPSNFDFEAERKASKSGTLEGAVAELPDGSQYPLDFVDISRMEREIGSSSQSQLQFLAKPGLIVVSAISRWMCTMAVRWAASQDVFSQLQPLPCTVRSALVANVLFPADMASAHQRGYVEDLVIQLDDNLSHRVNFIIPIRLRREIEIDAMHGTPFTAVPNLIVIPDITSECISNAVQRLALDGFFSFSKPIQSE